MKPINWQARAREAGASVRLLSELTGYGREKVRRTLATLTAWTEPDPDRAMFGIVGATTGDFLRAAIQYKERENEARQAFAGLIDRINEPLRNAEPVGGDREAWERRKAMQAAQKRKLEAILEDVSKSTHKKVPVAVSCVEIDTQKRTRCAFEPSFRFLNEIKKVA